MYQVQKAYKAFKAAKAPQPISLVEPPKQSIEPPKQAAKVVSTIEDDDDDDDDDEVPAKVVLVATTSLNEVLAMLKAFDAKCAAEHLEEEGEGFIVEQADYFGQLRNMMQMFALLHESGLLSDVKPTDQLQGGTLNINTPRFLITNDGVALASLIDQVSVPSSNLSDGVHHSLTWLVKCSGGWSSEG